MGYYRKQRNYENSEKYEYMAVWLRAHFTIWNKNMDNEGTHKEQNLSHENGCFKKSD